VTTDLHHSSTAHSSTAATTAEATAARRAPHRVAVRSRRAFVRQLGTTIGAGLGIALLPAAAGARSRSRAPTSAEDCEILCSPYNCTSNGCCLNAHVFYCRCSPYARYVCIPYRTCTSFCTHTCPTGQC